MLPEDMTISAMVDIILFIQGMYDGMYVSDLTNYEARMIRRLADNDVVVIENDEEVGDKIVRIP